MKKIIIAITILLFAATLTAYAGIYRETSTTPSSTNSGSNSDNSDGGNNGALFRNSSADNPGGRPGNGGGIGQDESPIGDGLPVLIVCSLIFIAVKFWTKKKNKNENSNDNPSITN